MSQRKDASLFSAGASRRSRVSPLAVETRHLRLGVTRTGGGVLIGAVLLAIWFGRGARGSVTLPNIARKQISWHIRFTPRRRLHAMSAWPMP